MSDREPLRPINPETNLPFPKSQEQVSDEQLQEYTKFLQSRTVRTLMAGVVLKALIAWVGKDFQMDDAAYIADLITSGLISVLAIYFRVRQRGNFVPPPTERDVTPR